MNLFAFLWQAYDGTFVNTVTTISGQGLTAVAELYNLVLSLAVVVFGALMLMGRITWAEISGATVKALIISAILTPAYFNPYVRDLFLNTAPDWISSALGLTAPSANSATEFSTIYEACRNLIAQARGAAGLMNVGAHIEIAICQLAIGIALLGVFIIFIAVRVLTGMLICAAPFVFPFYLFNSTRGIGDRLVGKFIGLMLMYLLIAVVIQITLQYDQTYMRDLGATTSIAQMIDTLFGISFVFVAALFLTFMLVGIAVFLGGGVAFSPRAAYAFAAKGVELAGGGAGKVLAIIRR